MKNDHHLLTGTVAYVISPETLSVPYEQVERNLGDINAQVECIRLKGKDVALFMPGIDRLRTPENHRVGTSIDGRITQMMTRQGVHAFMSETEFSDSYVLERGKFLLDTSTNVYNMLAKVNDPEDRTITVFIPRLMEVAQRTAELESDLAGVLREMADMDHVKLIAATPYDNIPKEYKEVFQ